MTRHNNSIFFTVIGGFLGSGKTSFLNSILANNYRSKRYAVLVNDFGVLNIDKSLIKSFDGKLLHLSNGCICCSVSNDLVDSMLFLIENIDTIDHILIEASGVSNPARIMDFARIDEELQPAAILVLVDCLNLERHIRDKMLKETIENQLASADIILLTKTDLINNEEQIKNAYSIIKSSQPDLPITTLANEEQSRVLLIDTLLSLESKISKDYILACKDKTHTKIFKTLVFKSKTSLQKESFLKICKDFSELILRGKGFVNCVDGVYIWQQIGRQIEFNKTNKSAFSCEIVLIGTAELTELKSKLNELGLEDYS